MYNRVKQAGRTRAPMDSGIMTSGLTCRDGGVDWAESSGLKNSTNNRVKQAERARAPIMSKMG